MRNVKGFTVIEVLIVLLIIGVLATIAIPRFGSAKDKAFDSASRSDLRNAISAQEVYMVNNQTYAALSDLSITTSAGVALGGGGSASGYSMTAKHAASSKTWTVVVGSGSSTDGKIQ